MALGPYSGTRAHLGLVPWLQLSQLEAVASRAYPSNRLALVPTDRLDCGVPDLINSTASSTHPSYQHQNFCLPNSSVVPPPTLKQVVVCPRDTVGAS